MNRNRSSLGKRPREAFAEEDTPEAQAHLEFTPSTDAAQQAEHAITRRCVTRRGSLQVRAGLRKAPASPLGPDRARL